MKLKVLSFYRGWASNEDAWEQGDVVTVSDAERDLPAPDAPDNQWRGTLSEYLLKTFPERFVEVKARRRATKKEAEG